MLDASSRYYTLETATYESSGQSIRYKRRRILPQPSAQTTLFEYTVKEEERLDQVATAGFGDPQQAYRLVDASAVLSPSELLVARRRIRIALSQL